MRIRLRSICFGLAAALLAAPAARTMDARHAPSGKGEPIFREARIVGERGGAPLYRKEVLSQIYTIDRIYKSMMGPVSYHHFPVLDGKPELVWLVGYRASMIEPDGETQISDDYMCHSNLNVSVEPYLDRFPTEVNLSEGRLFTLAQGQLSVELPEGFGIPMMSDFKAQLTAQVLNHNDPVVNLDLRQKIELDFVLNRDLEKPLTPLAATYANGMVLVDGPDGYFGFEPGAANPDEHGEGCSIGKGVEGGFHDLNDGLGRTFATFWVLPPGRMEHRTRVTKMMALPYDTTIHHITTHVHPFAVTLELRDVTANQTVYTARSKDVEGRIGIDLIEQYSSPDGIPVFKDHEYELIGIYDNTTDTNQDMMASMMLYVRANDMYDFYFRKR